MELPTIKPGSPQWDAWREYFQRHLGWTPEVMRRIIERAANAPLAMTVPTEYPEHFDMSFRCDPRWKAKPIREISSREMHENAQELQSRFGKNWGIKDLNKAIYRRPAWKALPGTRWDEARSKTPTDDELRSHYRKPEAAE